MADSIFRLWFKRFLCALCICSNVFFRTKVNVAAIDDGSSTLCDVNVSSFLPAPYSNMSTLICSPVWNSFVLRYFQSDDSVTIVLSGTYTTGWVGLGFSKDGVMVGSSAIVGWVENSGRGSIKQFLLQGYSPAEVVVNKGELQFTEVPPVVVYHKGAIYVAFQLKFALRLTRQQIILAKSDITPIQNRLPIHNDKRSITVEFSSGTVTHASANFEKLKRNHGILNVIGWGILLPCGAIVARYFKRLDPQWYYLHTSIQFVGFVIGLLGFAAGRYLYNKTHANFQVHRGIGIFVVLLSMLQVTAFFLRPEKQSKIRKYWNWYHHWVGRFALFFGAVNILLGVQFGGAGTVWKIGYGFLIAILLVTVIALEIFFRLKGSQKGDEADRKSVV